MLKIEEYVKLKNGKFVGSKQCVALVQDYQKFVKWPVRNGNAKDWVKNGNNGYVFIKMRPFFIPRPSDFAIFDIGPYGHIGIVVSSNPLYMRVFNQNWPKGDLTNPAIVTRFNYLRPKILGFLRKV